jgi:arylsulfatase A-like enzyme/Flp pilus assembly protein TadD
MTCCKKYFTILVFFLLFCVAVVFSAARPAVENILLITVDTLRADRVSFYSDRHLETPSMDMLARRSWVFMRAFAHNPVTLPSHVNILTGTTPPFHGISDNAGYILEDKFMTIAEVLKDKGLATGAFIGAFPLDSRFGLAQGFDVYDDSYGTKSPLEFFYVERRAEDVITPAVEWLGNQDDKWFCWVHVFDPHQPYLPPKSYSDKYQDDPYSGEVAYVDDQLGRLFDFLEEEGFLETTAIILTSDHGEGLGDHGEQTHSYFAYNTTIHIPLILFIPGYPHQKIQTNVSHVDIFPTICDLIGQKPPKFVQGESLLDLEQQNRAKDRKIYFESLTPYLNRGWAPLKGFIEGNLKFIHQPIEEVYDLEKDFQENNNLAKNHDLAVLKNGLKALEDTLRGEVVSTRTREISSETQEKLRSLGYLVGSSSSTKTQFTENDDLKILLPLQSKMLHGVALHHTGQTEKGIELLKEVISANPSFAIALTNLATIYQETGQRGKAIQVLREGLALNQNHVGLMSRLGILLSETDQLDEATSLLKRCTEIEDFNPEYWNYLGIAYYKKAEFQPALEAFHKAVSLDEDYALAYNNIGNIYLAVYLKTKNWRSHDLAVFNFQKAIEKDPKLASPYNGLGGLFMEDGKIDDAILLWKQSLEFSPSYAFPLFNLGIALLKKGNKAEALIYFQRYKNEFYDTLSPDEKIKIDDYIRRCKDN